MLIIKFSLAMDKWPKKVCEHYLSVFVFYMQLLLQDSIIDVPKVRWCVECLCIC